MIQVINELQVIIQLKKAPNLWLPNRPFQVALITRPPEDGAFSPILIEHVYILNSTHPNSYKSSSFGRFMVILEVIGYWT